MIQVTAEIAADRCLEVLAHHPSGLFSDFDGALSVIAATPDAARPYPGASEAIARLKNLVDQFSIVTGRAASDAMAMIGVPEIRVIGNHGLETIYRGTHTAHPVGIAAKASVEVAMAEISAGISGLTDPTGMIFENKVYSASIHYRNTPAPDVIESYLKPLVLRIAEQHDLRITSGKMLFELRPQAVINKGTALDSVITEFSMGGAIFIGDDVTDVDGFDTLHRLRAERSIATLAIGVMSFETPQSVIDKSDVLLSGVEDTVQMLTLLADRLEGK